MTVAYFDGASRGNPGESGAGACIINDDGTMAWESCRALGRGTNNEAEYHALIMLLEEISKRGLKRVTVRGDSRLVVLQVNGEWKVREDRLRILADRARALVRESGATLEWVPREQNSMADALSNKALDGETITKINPFPEERLEHVSDGIFIAHGSSDYAVDISHSSCSCPSFRSRGKCKHLDAALSFAKKEKRSCSSS
ncbi:MAG: ribonuclease HI family protein [Thermovirgaceae bacterium]|nr:ribonuclease HI family protein [Thermovirgaceae bacterium]